MTKSPSFIERGKSLAFAAQQMRSQGIAHLPVLENGRLVGTVTDRDVLVVAGLCGMDPSHVKVDEVMNAEPVCVSPDTCLWDVVARMETTKAEAVIVMDFEHVVGIFTTTDALRALGRALEVRSVAQLLAA